MRMISVVCGVVVAAACGGCLQKEVGQTIYLSPTGVVWSVIEKEVRSDEKEAAARIREEQDYALAAGAGQHDVARAFHRLGAQAVTTTWLRRERPYAVMTEARFADVRQLATAILREAKIQGDVTLVRDGCRTTFGMRMNSDPSPAAEDSALDALLGELGTYRFVLSEGRFISAGGFEILGDGSVAVPDERTIAPVPRSPGEGGTGGVLTLSLAWVDEGCGH
jgi:hypothetical protein